MRGSHFITLSRKCVCVCVCVCVHAVHTDLCVFRFFYSFSLNLVHGQLFNVCDRQSSFSLRSEVSRGERAFFTCRGKIICSASVFVSRLSEEFLRTSCCDNIVQGFPQEVGKRRWRKCRHST